MAIEQEDDILILLTRYLQGEVDDQERQKVSDWIATSKENESYFQDLEVAWENSDAITEFDSIDVDAEWSTFKQSITDVSSLPASSKKTWNSQFLKIAASVIVVIGVSLFFLKPFSNEITLVAENTGKTKFVLPDESVVWLNKGSELTYQKGFEGEVRETTLKGEAFFEITKDPNKPFEVIANSTTTRVLGTSFNLKADQTTKQTELVLVTGKVQFSAANEQKVLLPGDKVVAVPGSQLIKEVNADPNFDSWKSGVLKFQETSLSTMAEDINKFYGVSLVFENVKFKDCSLTATFDNETITQVLETLVVLFEITYEEIDTNKILIKGGNCSSDS